jgi:hypothetical protein
MADMLRIPELRNARLERSETDYRRIIDLSLRQEPKARKLIERRCEGMKMRTGIEIEIRKIWTVRESPRGDNFD